MRLENSLQFDGSQHIEVKKAGYTEQGAVRTEGTVETWIKLESLDKWQPFYTLGGGQNGMALGINPDNKAIFSTRHLNNTNTVVASSIDISLNEWTHIAGSFNADGAYIYVNGELQGQELKKTSFRVGTSTHGVGGGVQDNLSGGNSGAWFNGLVSDLRVWSIYRTQEDIVEGYKKTLTGNEAGLVLNWLFNEPAIGTAISNVDSQESEGLNTSRLNVVADAPVHTTWKYLVKTHNKIQSLSETGEWIDTGLTEPLTQVDFEQHGIEDLSAVPKEKWQELDDSFEVITWTDEEPVDGKYETKWLYTNTDPFSPLDRLNEEDEFEVLTYSDEADEVPSTTVSEEGVVDSGKLFTATLDDFDIVTGVEVK